MTMTSIRLTLFVASFSIFATAAVAETLQQPTQGGPSITSETEGFIGSFLFAVARCWNHNPGSDAAGVAVRVGFSLDREGRVQGNEVRLLSSDGDQSATNTAFEAARRAILRCQSGGYELPADRYDQWKDIVITFDPSGMRLR